MIFARWFGGSGYSHGDPVDDLEVFPSMAAAVAALRERRDQGYSFRCSFEFANREPEDVFTPCVEDDSSMWLWFSAHKDDGIVTVPDYPDRVVSFGPRGGVRIEHA